MHCTISRGPMKKAVHFAQGLVFLASVVGVGVVAHAVVCGSYN